MFKVIEKNTRTISITSFWWFYCKLLTYFTLFSSVFVVDFEHVSVYWNSDRISFLYFSFF